MNTILNIESGRSTKSVEVSPSVLGTILRAPLNIEGGELYLNQSSAYLDYIETLDSDAVHLIHLNDRQKWALRSIDTARGFWSASAADLEKITGRNWTDLEDEGESFGVDILNGKIYHTDDLDQPSYLWKDSGVRI